MPLFLSLELPFILQRSNVTLTVRARDLGQPGWKYSTVHVHVTITQTMNAYPQWVEDYSSTVVYISENVEQDQVIKTLKAVSSIPDQIVNYVIQPGKTPEQNNPRTFYSRTDDRTNEMLLLVYDKDLDYELMKKYTLTLKASVGIDRMEYMLWKFLKKLS